MTGMPQRDALYASLSDWRTREKLAAHGVVISDLFEHAEYFARKASEAGCPATAADDIFAAAAGQYLASALATAPKASTWLARAGNLLLIYGDIGGEITADSFTRELEQIQTSPIELRISSPGGSIAEGMAIYNAIRRRRGQGFAITAYIDGAAYSAASVIAMAADEIVMSRGSTMMVHGVWTSITGNSETLAVEADLLDRMTASLAMIYSERNGESVAIWRERLAGETWYTADEAVAAGLADRVAK